MISTSLCAADWEPVTLANATLNSFFAFEHKCVHQKWYRISGVHNYSYFVCTFYNASVIPEGKMCNLISAKLSKHSFTKSAHIRTIFSLYVYWCRHIVCFVFDCNMCGPDSDIRHKSCDLWWQRIENTEHRHCSIFSNRPELIILKQILLCRTVFK